MVLYIHGQGGSTKEAEHYKRLIPHCDVIGLDYKSYTPWDAGKEIHEAIATLRASYDKVTPIANSIGAFFLMNADVEKYIVHAYFISPIVNMEKLIMDRMRWANITEAELQVEGTVQMDFGEDLSWEYFDYVRSHPVRWNVPTDILYGDKDGLTSIDTMKAFVMAHPSRLTIMERGEHWFHTEEQMQFLDNWIRKNR